MFFLLRYVELLLSHMTNFRRINKKNNHIWFFFSMTNLHPNRVILILENCSNTVVSNRFHSVKILLFSSARSRDFDGTPGTELPVLMYTTKTPIDMCRFNVRS